MLLNWMKGASSFTCRGLSWILCWLLLNQGFPNKVLLPMKYFVLFIHKFHWSIVFKKPQLFNFAQLFLARLSRLIFSFSSLKNEYFENGFNLPPIWWPEMIKSYTDLPKYGRALSSPPPLSLSLLKSTLEEPFPILEHLTEIIPAVYRKRLFLIENSVSQCHWFLIKNSLFHFILIF